jgi:hypothetical protein
MLLQMQELYEMEWFDTFGQILEILKVAQKQIQRKKQPRKENNSPNNNQNLSPSYWAYMLDKDAMMTLIQKL